MKISLVIPLFDEEQIIPVLWQRMDKCLKHLDDEVEIILVDDGSQDATADKAAEWILRDARVMLIQLSRNFGHQAAITAGLRESTGDAVIVMDGDLQDPPEVISEMLDQWHQGYQVVLAARKSRQDSLLRRCLFGSFYKVFRVLTDLPPGEGGVFGLMDRKVVKHFLALQERHRFIPGLRRWLGFKQTTIWYDRQSRQAGEAKQSVSKLLNYGLDAIFSFSHKPLRLSFILGFILSLCCFSYGLVLLVQRILQINIVSGFTTLAVSIFFLSGVLLMSNGIMGEYLGRIYDEVKARPLFIISGKFYRAPHQNKVIYEEYT